jgi:hypothetical protein
MKFRKPSWLISVAMIGAVLLSSCNLGATPIPTEDVGAVQTQAFNIVLTQSALQMTQIALANPTALPTATPLPTGTLGAATFAPIGGEGAATPIPGFTPLASPVPTLGGAIATITTKNGCNDGTYMGETEPAKTDWAVLTANTEYSKAWTIQNVGTCPWDEGYAFVILPERSSPEIRWVQTSIVIKKNDEFTLPQHGQSFVVKFTTPRKAGKYEAYWKLHDDAMNYFGPMVWIRFEIK